MKASFSTANDNALFVANRSTPLPEPPKRISLTNMDIEGERALTDQKIASSEARFDAKIVRMDSKLDTLLAEIRGARTDNKSNRNVIATTMVGSVIGLAGLMYALISYGSAQFSNGAMVRDVAAKVAHVRPISPSR